MPWTGYPETMVTQLTYTEWVFFPPSAARGADRLLDPRGQRVGALRQRALGLVHGRGRQLQGAVQIVAQWAERENLGPRDRVWQWVHWKNPTNDDVVVKPYLLLAPPIGDRAPHAVERDDRPAVRLDAGRRECRDHRRRHCAAGPGRRRLGRRRWWRRRRRAGGDQGLQLTVMPRAVGGERIRKVVLTGDLRYVPTGSSGDAWTRSCDPRYDARVRPAAADSNHLGGGGSARRGTDDRASWGRPQGA